MNSEKLEMLLLARLLPCKTAPSVAVLGRDLSPFYRDPPGTAVIEEALARLREAGAVAAKGRQLTEKGRERALAGLGLPALPARWTWKTVKDKVLTAKALGLTQAEADKLLRSPAKLTAALLRRELSLPESAGTTVQSVLEALTCRELGHPELSTLEQLMAAVLSEHIGADPPLQPDEVLTQVPRVLLGAHGPALRARVVAGWADHAPAEVRPLDLASFAHTVNDEARTCPTGRFGDDKVFVGHLWGLLESHPAIGALGLVGFKEKLVEANRAGLLQLGRADLVQKMDPAEVKRSETSSMGSVYHFVVTEPVRQGRTA